jgi:hypothetical protein
MTPAKQVENREQPEPVPAPLDEAVEQIRADAEREADKYARESIVSKGGE